LVPYILAQVAGGLVALELFKRVKLWICEFGKFEQLWKLYMSCNVYNLQWRHARKV
jgi:hypothetical protein